MKRRPGVMRTTAAILVGTAGLLPGCASPHAAVPEPDPRLAPVAFLAGTWRTLEQDGVWTEEHWTDPAGGCMLGGSRTIGPRAEAPGGGGAGDEGVNGLKFYEFLRISVADGGIVYHAAPLGRSPATAFRMVEGAGENGWVVFENPAHDFPKRISYRLEGPDRLHATIEGDAADEQGRQEWVFLRTSERKRLQ